MAHPYAFRVTFTPDGESPEEASTARTVRVATDADTRETVYSEAIAKANRTGAIDPYALRNYWSPAHVAVEYDNPSWGSLDDITAFLDLHDSVDGYEKHLDATEAAAETPHIKLDVTDKNHTVGDDVCHMFPEVTYVGPPAIHFFYDVGHPDKTPFKDDVPDGFLL